MVSDYKVSYSSIRHTPAYKGVPGLSLPGGSDHLIALVLAKLV